MNELEKARQNINEIDIQMAHLFEKRMKESKTIAEFKKERALPIYDERREAEVIKSSLSYIQDDEIASHYTQFLKNVMSLSRNYQSSIIKGLRVAYSGVEGAFAHIACGKMFEGAELIAYPSFSSAYKAVENDNVDCVVLPIENSFAGEVDTVLDLMYSGNLFINRVMDLPITHNLIAKKNTAIQDIKTIISHPQALSQCEDYITSHGFDTQSFSNTAAAAKFVKENTDPSIATIASAETASIFDLEVLEAAINDSRSNTTRFAAFSRVQHFPGSKKLREDEHFILVFTVRNQAGSLAQTLNIIGAHGYNMRALKSRPMKDLDWNYYFYIEADGNINNENGQDMLRELSVICAGLKLVGTYCTS